MAIEQFKAAPPRAAAKPRLWAQKNAPRLRRRPSKPSSGPYAGITRIRSKVRAAWVGPISAGVRQPPFVTRGSVARQDERGRVVVTVTLPRYVRCCRFDALARRTLTCGFLVKARVLDVHQSCKCVHTGVKRAGDSPQTPQPTKYLVTFRWRAFLRVMWGPISSRLMKRASRQKSAAPAGKSRRGHGKMKMSGKSH